MLYVHLTCNQSWCVQVHVLFCDRSLMLTCPVSTGRFRSWSNTWREGTRLPLWSHSVPWWSLTSNRRRVNLPSGTQGGWICLLTCLRPMSLAAWSEHSRSCERSRPITSPALPSLTWLVSTPCYMYVNMYVHMAHACCQVLIIMHMHVIYHVYVANQSLFSCHCVY